MYKNSPAKSGSFNPRIFFAFLLCSLGLYIGMLSFAANPPAGTISATTTTAVSWVGTAAGTGNVAGESDCVEGVTCDTFTLTVDPASDWTGKRVEVRIQQAASYDDTDLVIHKGDNSGPIVATSGNGAGITEVGYITPSTDGTGVFSVHVIYFTTVAGDQYHGSATVVPLTPTPPPAATVDITNKIGYENFEAPGVITPVTVSTGPTVEWMGRSAGEPSIGVNWKSLNSANGVTNFQSDLETLFINFSATPTNGGGATATWANRPAPTQKVIDSDPIGFTDFRTGRAFAAELTATSPTCKISFTDNDGQTWSPTSGPLGSGIDHETIGGGPYHAPIPTLPTPYPHAVYYCSQDLVAAFCLRSDDGGVTWGPPVQTYTSQCGGLHGHVKVAPDGTVYLPNNSCGGTGAVVVSEDNGVTWNIRPVQNATSQTRANSNLQDPAVGIDNTGRVYFAMSSSTVAGSAIGGSNAVVATSTDRGQTWQNIFDVGAVYGLKNIAFPAAVAGDAGRASVAFYGSTTSGDGSANSFNGVWHLYVANTFDGGQTWTTTDATPK